MSSTTRDRMFPIMALVGVLALAGCGGGGGGGFQGVYGGDVEVENQTDLSGTGEILYAFDMASVGTQLWTGNLLSDVVYPGQVAFVGTFDEDFYDAEADLDFGPVTFFDVFVQDARTTTFEIY